MSLLIVFSHPNFCSSLYPEAVHHVSVSINVSHSLLVCGEAWGTDPHFSWLHERAAITESVGKVSKDGATLFVYATPICGHFTCMISNKLGYSSATYSAGTNSQRSRLFATLCWEVNCIKSTVLCNMH